MFRVYFRNREGYDTKVMGWEAWSETAGAPASWKDIPSGELAGEGIAYVDFTVYRNDVQHANARGVPTKRIVGGNVLDRSPEAIETDRGNANYYEELSEREVIASLMGRDKETHLMNAANLLFIYLDGVQTATGIADDALPPEALEAKNNLQFIRGAILYQIQIALDKRDEALARLDPL